MRGTHFTIRWNNLDYTFFESLAAEFQPSYDKSCSNKPSNNSPSAGQAADVQVQSREDGIRKDVSQGGVHGVVFSGSGQGR